MHNLIGHFNGGNQSMIEGRMADTYAENSNTTDKLNRFFYRLISEGLSLGADQIRFERESELEIVLLNRDIELKRSSIKLAWFEMILAWLVDRTVSPAENNKRLRPKTHLVLTANASDDISFISYIPCGNEYLECQVSYYHQHQNSRIIALSGFVKNFLKPVTSSDAIQEELPPKIEVADDYFLSNSEEINNRVKKEPQISRILVVEDDVDQRSIIEMVLKDAGYEVYLAGDGREAFKVLEESMPDLVVSDLMMPEVDGAELIRNIKKDSRFSDLPILVLTVINDSEKEFQLLSLGVDDYCEKTVQRNILLKRIENLLRRSKN